MTCSGLKSLHREQPKLTHKMEVISLAPVYRIAEMVRHAALWASEKYLAHDMYHTHISCCSHSRDYDQQLASFSSVEREALVRTGAHF